MVQIEAPSTQPYVTGVTLSQVQVDREWEKKSSDRDRSPIIVTLSHPQSIEVQKPKSKFQNPGLVPVY